MGTPALHGRPARSMDEIAAIREFNRFYTKKIGVLHGGLLRHGFTLAEIRILWEIRHRDHITAQEVAAELDMDVTFVSKLLWRLKTHDIVRTERSETDGRIRHLRLTKWGQGAIRTLEQQSSDDVSAMIRELSPANRRKLVDAMKRIQQLLGLKRDQPWSWLLREPRAGDYGWVVERHGAIYADEYGWDSSFEALVAEIVAAFIRNFKPEREKCWIAERDGERAGCVFLVEKSGAVGQLRLLLVEPTARGAGIGGRLVHECVLYARSVGYSKLVLWTQANLHAARRIYRNAGFRLAREEKHRSFEYWELDLRAPARSAARSTRKAR
jgi:DNA-binding MarR family transcriptional regulator/N-acetylglutamate synthase-like GNAT family acetyltransferase